MNIPRQVKTKNVAAIVLIAILITTVGCYFTFAQSPSTTFTVSPGIYPGAPSFTVWREGSYYFAKDAKGEIKYSGTDASTVIQSAINASTSGGKIFIKAGEYRYTGTINLSGKNGVSLEGEFGATILKPASLGSVALTIGTKKGTTLDTFYCSIENLVIDGEGVNGAGIDVNTCKGLLLKGIIFRNLPYRGLRATVWSSDQVSSEKIVVEDCFFEGCGVVLGGVVGGRMRNCFFFGDPVSPHNSIIDYSFGEAVSIVQEFQIINCHFKNMTTFPSGWYGLIAGFQYAKTAKIIDCEFENVNSDLIKIYPMAPLGPENLDIVGNSFKNTGRVLFAPSGSSFTNVRFEENNIISTTYPSGSVDVGGSGSIKIKNNHINNTLGGGIYLSLESGTVEVEGNRFENVNTQNYPWYQFGYYIFVNGRYDVMLYLKDNKEISHAGAYTVPIRLDLGNQNPAIRIFAERNVFKRDNNFIGANHPALGNKGYSQLRDLLVNYASEFTIKDNYYITDAVKTPCKLIDTQNSGTATGTSPIIVAHGLAETPTTVIVTVQGSTPYKVSYTADATYIYIYHDAGTSITVSWYAEYKPP